jgi:hypothetical protein
MKLFSAQVIAQLGFYVYRLIDPRNGETFYVGKGRGNRVFSHANGDIEVDSLTEKTSRILEIKLTGLEIAHVIHRHGMDEKTAFEVEAALIDAYSGLTNIMDGHGNNDYGAMHAIEIKRKYQAETAVLNHKILMITVNRSAAERSLYDATRFAWRLSVTKAQKAEYILAIQQGLVIGVFAVTEWLEATVENFPGREAVDGRYGFIGVKASLEVSSEYLNKIVPEKYRKKGASNPIKYSW